MYSVEESKRYLNLALKYNKTLPTKDGQQAHILKYIPEHALYVGYVNDTDIKSITPVTWNALGVDIKNNGSNNLVFTFKNNSEMLRYSYKTGELVYVENTDGVVERGFIAGSTSNGMYILVDDSDPFRIICYLESNNQKLKSVKLCLDYLKDLDKIKE